MWQGGGLPLLVVRIKWKRSQHSILYFVFSRMTSTEYFTCDYHENCCGDAWNRHCCDKNVRKNLFCYMFPTFYLGWQNCTDSRTDAIFCYSNNFFNLPGNCCLQFQKENQALLQLCQLVLQTHIWLEKCEYFEYC